MTAPLPPKDRLVGWAGLAVIAVLALFGIRFIYAVTELLMGGTP